MNLGRLGNALAIWLGVQPADLFLYIFLPPMLLDEAVRIEYFIFKKVVQPTCRSCSDLLLMQHCGSGSVKQHTSMGLLEGLRYLGQSRSGGTCIAAAQVSAHTET